MKAVRIHEYGGPEVLLSEEVPKPEPGPAQIPVKAAAARLNPVAVAVLAFCLILFVLTRRLDITHPINLP
mgnify:CR=1 FL=1